MRVISKDNSIERRLSKRILQKINLSVKSYATSREIDNGTIVNISIGGMQFYIPDTSPKLQIGEICSFIFDLPVIGETTVLGEIRYYRDFVDPDSGHVVHYGVKFLHISKSTWNHINQYCQDETEYTLEPFAPKNGQKITKAPAETESLTTKTLSLIKVQIRLDDGTIFKGKVKDINFGGLQLEISELIPVNVHLNVHVSFQDQTFTTDGLCNWCTNVNMNLQDKPSSFLVNIGFHDIPQQHFEKLQLLMVSLANHIAESIVKTYFQSVK